LVSPFGSLFISGVAWAIAAMASILSAFIMLSYQHSKDHPL
jgi:hypothetical protein